MQKKPKAIDLRQLLSAAEQPGHAARGSRLLRFAGQLVSIASVLAPGDPHESTIGCRRRPERRACPGRLAITRGDIDDEIRWECSVCGNTGTIVGWQGSRWDREPALKSGELVSLLQVRAERAGRRPPRRPGRAYEFSVELIGGPLDLDETVARRVRIGGDKALHDLHLLIQRAFDRQDDEPYEFMFGAPYEPDARRFAGGLVATPDEPDESCETQLLTLDSLDLLEGQVFGYLFDFGEEWVHRLTVVSASKEVSYAIHPRIVERVGSSPPQYSDVDELWDDELLWNDIDEYPLTGLYGPYVADEAPDGEAWLAMEDLERLLLVIEAHSQKLPEDHPPIDSAALHAVVHFLAETKLAEGDRKATSWLEARLLSGPSRHQAIHELGEQLVREQLHEPPKQLRAKGEKKGESAKPHRNRLH